MSGLIIPGNLTIKNGGKLISTGGQSWQNENIYKEGADMVIDGTTVRVDGEIKVGGYIEVLDTSESVVTE